MWWARALLDRFPWAPWWLGAAFVLAWLLSCASIPTENGPMHPGLRVVARCPTEHGVMVLAYPASRTLVGGLTLGATALGATIGTVIYPGVGTAAGAGVGALLGVIVESVRVLWAQPDPVPTCAVDRP